MQVGLSQDRTRYNTGCAFVDYDRDGNLDLFVANYLRFDFSASPKARTKPLLLVSRPASRMRTRGLPFETNLLYRNTGKEHLWMFRKLPGSQRRTRIIRWECLQAIS